jgi:type II secretory pathway pseudopilin PulG
MVNFEAGRSDQRGLTYVWVLLSVALLGLSLALAEQVASTATRRDQEKELLAVGRQFRQAIQRYYEMPVAGVALQEYPLRLENLLADQRSGVLRRHLRKIFIDPMTRKSQWGVVKINQRVIGVYSLSTDHPIKKDGFEVEDIGFRDRKKYQDWIFTYPANALAGLDIASVTFGRSEEIDR